MRNLLRRITATRAGYGITIMRIIGGIIFTAHGAQKLFGWFGGFGLAGVSGWLESIGLYPGLFWALLSGSAEFFGGLALIVGLLVRPLAIVLSVNLLVAIFAVNIGNGFFMATDGIEFALAMLAISIALLVEGAGKLSLDGLIAGRPARAGQPTPQPAVTEVR